MGILETVIIFLYRISFLRRILLPGLKLLNRNKLDADSLRRVFAQYHDIKIDKFTYGGCFDHQKIAPGTIIGKYSSIASGVYVIASNHDTSHISTHPFLFKPHLGVVSEDNRKKGHVEIGNDVWIGTNAIILPSASVIGDGAVVAAGAVVTKDVPPYAIVAGVPAQIVRFRFCPETIELLLSSQWWWWSPNEVFQNWKSFMNEGEFRELVGKIEHQTDLDRSEIDGSN